MFGPPKIEFGEGYAAIIHLAHRIKIDVQISVIIRPLRSEYLGVKTNSVILILQQLVINFQTQKVGSHFWT